jgi:hypothetical protein
MPELSAEPCGAGPVGHSARTTPPGSGVEEDVRVPFRLTEVVVVVHRRQSRLAKRRTTVWRSRMRELRLARRRPAPCRSCASRLLPAVAKAVADSTPTSSSRWFSTRRRSPSPLPSLVSWARHRPQDLGADSPTRTGSWNTIVLSS